jgi:hypothetical protein
MDLSKYPLERLFYLVAAVIPGFTALLIFQLAAPGSFNWFFTLGFVGYKTKLSLILIAAFLIGNSLNVFVVALVGAVGGAVAGVVRAIKATPPKLAYSYDVAPWRDGRWRLLVKRQLGEQAPDNTQLISDQIYNQRLGMIKLLPAEQQADALLALQRETGKTRIDDMKWEQWYDHYHSIILQPENRTVESYVHDGLVASMETTSLYILFAAGTVPSLRHWWCILPACIWVLIAYAQAHNAYYKATNKWLTLADQVRYLTKVEPL